MTPDDIVFAMLMTLGGIAVLFWVVYGIQVYLSWRRNRRA